jgi:hypothetical protein
MAYLTEKSTKLVKKLKKSEKHGKKCVRDLSDTDSDSDQDNRSGSTGNPVDKRLKLEQPTGIHLKSTDTHPNKSTKLALDIIRANEIAIENSKFESDCCSCNTKDIGDNFCNSRSTTPGKLLNKSNKWLNLKKQHLNRAKNHLKGLYEPKRCQQRDY